MVAPLEVRAAYEEARERTEREYHERAMALKRSTSGNPWRRMRSLHAAKTRTLNKLRREYEEAAYQSSLTSESK